MFSEEVGKDETGEVDRGQRIKGLWIKQKTRHLQLQGTQRQLGRAALPTMAHLPWIPVTHRKPAKQAGRGARDHTEAPLNVTGA